MHTNVNLAAPVGALALLGTGFLLLVAAAVLIQSLTARRRQRAKLMLITMAAIAAAYLAAMLVFSLASHETVLARGEEKHFCELDCHLAYSIVNSRQTKTVGEPPPQMVARGEFTVITVRTRFDERTISSGRGNAPLTPNPRRLLLIDDRGNRYAPAAQFGTNLTTALSPGESYTTDVVFDLPAGAKPATLLINEDDFITRLVIGHENSLWHRQTKFQL